MFNLLQLMDVVSAALCLYAALFAYTQPRHRRLFRRLAAVFLAIFLTSLNDFGIDYRALLGPGWHRLPMLIGFCAQFLIFPLLFGYMQRLVAEGPAPRQPAFWRHVLPLLLAVLASMAVLALPGNITAITPTPENQSTIIILKTIGGLILVLQFGLLAQWIVYAVMMGRLLKTYRKRVRDLHSNVERRNLDWITWTIRALLLYAILSLVDGITEAGLGYESFPREVEAALRLGLVSAISLWSLRQYPGLRSPEPARTPLPQSSPAAKPAAKPAASKYANSALTHEDQSRIAAKLNQIMQRDALYLDPDLSLSQLAATSGINAHYISQTLNEAMNLSFFDFVNGWRIRAAKDRLISSDDTILAIAFGVGFNTRSAFYRAFGKVAGQTPSAFRAAGQK